VTHNGITYLGFSPHSMGAQYPTSNSQAFKVNCLHDSNNYDMVSLYWFRFLEYLLFWRN